MKSTKLFLVMLYCDSTGLFSKRECDNNNLTEMLFPEWILQEWYEKNEKIFIAECEENSVNAPCFKTWITDVYTADDTEGLYDFAVEKGYDPIFDMLDTQNAVVYENAESETVIIFTGTTLECRKWAKEHDWKYNHYFMSFETLEEEEEEVDLEMLFS